jgi:hypothetical protein
MKVAVRCPLLARCERRAETLAIANFESPKKALGRNKQSPVVGIVGEHPSLVGGSRSFGVSNLCPEVACFEQAGVLAGFQGAPITSGSYDVDFPDEKYLPSQTGHYTECVEFCTSHTKPSATASKRSWLKSNYKWIIDTLIAIITVLVAFVAIGS